jgi:hypothetical protein
MRSGTLDLPEGPRGPDEWLVTLAWVVQNLTLNVAHDNGTWSIRATARLGASTSWVQHFEVPGPDGQAMPVGPTTLTISDHFGNEFPLGFDPWVGEAAESASLDDQAT